MGSARSAEEQALSRPRVSVIVPIYNGEADLPELLACLFAQTYGASPKGDTGQPSGQTRGHQCAAVEYLLVDNKSTDRSWEKLQAAAMTARDRGFCLRALQELEIQSSYAARNTGVREARGDILVFTDGDCRPEPQWLAELLAAFDRPDGDRVGLVAGEILALAGNSFWERYSDHFDLLSQRYTLQHTFLPYAQTANLAVRRSVLAAIGLFRPYLTTGGDADFCWRAQQETPWQLVAAPQAIVRHRHRATFADLMSQFRRYGRSNRYLHELHGAPLMPERRWQRDITDGLRWLLKDVPRWCVRRFRSQATLVDLLATPVTLVGARARWQAQTTARLPETARQIPKL